jgi:hypothetical protein
MMDCPRESDVLEAVAFDRVRQMQDHLDACASCAEVAGIAAALRHDYEASVREAHVPSAGVVWWRATIRARADAARAVSQPITLAQGAAAASAVGLAFGFAGVAWRSLTSDTSLSDILVRLGARSDELATASALVIQHALPVALALAACLVIAPVALYFALSDD